MAEKLRPVHCKRCDRLFHLCRSCDRGQSYCSPLCRQASRQEILEQARRKYARSEQGKKKNRERQRRFRERNSLKLLRLQKTVTDPSSQGAPAVVSFGHGTTGMEEAGDDDPEVVSEEQTVPSAGGGFRIFKEHRLEKAPEMDGWESMACCHVCGRPGVVFCEKRRRGRFRWMHFL